MNAKYNGVSPDGLNLDMLERMMRVNRLLHTQVNYRTVTSGEMPCPECRTGSLCYLISAGRSTVECTTPGCVTWDKAPIAGD